MHGNFAPDINNTWGAIVGPGVVHKGVDQATFVDHADLPPTMMTLLCLQDAPVTRMEAVLDRIPGCAGGGSEMDRKDRDDRGDENIGQLNERGQALLDEIREMTHFK